MHIHIYMNIYIYTYKYTYVNNHLYILPGLPDLGLFTALPFTSDMPDDNDDDVYLIQITT
jgi:hypothetical protein